MSNNEGGGRREAAKGPSKGARNDSTRLPGKTPKRLGRFTVVLARSWGPFRLSLGRVGALLGAHWAVSVVRRSKRCERYNSSRT